MEFGRKSLLGAAHRCIMREIEVSCINISVIDNLSVIDITSVISDLFLIVSWFYSVLFLSVIWVVRL